MAVSAPIVLLTDFGARDPFVGIVKGRILSGAPKANIVDLCHEIPPQDVRAAALALRVSVPYFPKGSLFVTIVDPGVGSKRRILMARTEGHRFLCPDNGVLSWLTDGIIECRSVENKKYFAPAVSTTFHGRDIFAPVAAALSRGVMASKLGPRIQSAVRIPWPKATSTQGEILSFDRFGNALTNLPSAAVPPRARLTFRGRDLGPLRTHYAEVPPGRTLAVAGSAGLVELSTRAGDFHARTRARPGDPVHVRNR